MASCAPVFVVRPDAYAGGYWRWSVASSLGRKPHSVAVCRSTGAVECSCEHFWYRCQMHEPDLLTPRYWCKHIKAVLRQPYKESSEDKPTEDVAGD